MTMVMKLKFTWLLTCLISSLAVAHLPEPTPGEGAAGLEGVMLGQTAKAKLVACRDSFIEQGSPIATTVHSACYSETLFEIRTTLARCGEGGRGNQKSLCDGFKSVIETIDDPDFTSAIAE